MIGYSFLFPIIMIAVMGFIFYRVFGGIYKNAQNRKRLMQEGTLTMAHVLGIAQTGTTVNQVPEMRVQLEIPVAGGQPRRIEVKQLIDLGNIPRAGERVYVLIDPKDPNNVVLAPSPTGGGMQVPVMTPDGRTQNMDMGSEQVKDMMSLPPELRERGVPGVAKVISVMPLQNHMYSITIDIDNIGQPLKRATFTQMIDGAIPPVGSRIYILIDPQNPATMALMPLSYSNGQTLPAGANRLDPLVLGPQLLQLGAKATGTVLSAKPEPMANPLLESQGFSKWSLVMNVKPISGLLKPYEANLVISLTSKEKADRMAHAGAELPVRYDSNDPQTFAIDSIAMGYPDPYVEVQKAFEKNKASDPYAK